MVINSDRTPAMSPIFLSPNPEEANNDGITYPAVPDAGKVTFQAVGPGTYRLTDLGGNDGEWFYVGNVGPQQPAPTLTRQ
jgi:hypothetical protein